MGEVAFADCAVPESARLGPEGAGMAIFNVVPDPRSLSPWAGFAVLLAYAAVSLAIAGLLLARRDA